MTSIQVVWGPTNFKMQLRTKDVTSGRIQYPRTHTAWKKDLQQGTFSKKINKANIKDRMTYKVPPSSLALADTVMTPSQNIVNT